MAERITMDDFIFIYITNPTKAEARKIAKHLLKKKLIACANIHGPVNSLYPWQGKLTDEEEYILIVKTSPSYWERVKREVEKIHSYTVPCIVKISVSSNRKYSKWLKGELRDI